mmetsp:Transcript_25593/g.37810  ORF Transcript_25593/g.37810 Transcript_25593/m.37810 type:complete len:600 (+) Transcript_25593:51-1850(+)
MQHQQQQQQQQRLMQMRLQQQLMLQKKKLPSSGNAITQQNSTTPQATSSLAAVISASGPAVTPTKILSVPNPQMYFPNEQMKRLLKKCDWMDRTIYVSKLLLGGSSINGFLRSTATAQRIKKQRARQIKLTATADEDLKQQAMNTRMAKKIRSELYSGLVFCQEMHNIVNSVVKELDPAMQVPQLMRPNPVACGLVPAPVAFSHMASPAVPMTSPAPPAPASLLSKSLASMKKSGLPSSTASLSGAPQTDRHQNFHSALHFSKQQQARTKQLQERLAASASQQQNFIKGPIMGADNLLQRSSAGAASPGDPTGSTLRKLRKRKFPANFCSITIPDTDPTTNKKYAKKDQAFRFLEVCRYRALVKGDYVAAKVSSRDLWILARVVNDYKGYAQSSPMEFLQIPKRDAQFRDNPVLIQDVEDKASEHIAVSRNLILPLPRTFTEAAEWGGRCRKGFRVYAMYPMTTSLYSGTVIDNTTYCREDDDIIVVEFDGDEPNAVTGKMPQYHIPARFVTLIPKEFPAAQNPNKKRKASTTASSLASQLTNPKPNKRANNQQTPSKTNSSQQRHKRDESSDSALNDMLDEIAYGDLTMDNFDMGFQG